MRIAVEITGDGGVGDAGCRGDVHDSGRLTGYGHARLLPVLGPFTVIVPRDFPDDSAWPMSGACGLPCRRMKVGKHSLP